MVPPSYDIPKLEGYHGWQHLPNSPPKTKRKKDYVFSYETKRNLELYLSLRFSRNLCNDFLLANGRSAEKKEKEKQYLSVFVLPIVGEKKKKKTGGTDD